MSNDYPWVFLDQLRRSEGPVLDCGSGERSLPGVFSLEYDLTPGVDLRADGACLPFPDDTFALVLSQAVLEHVTQPQVHVDEIVRVLRPGGFVYAAAAFLQPVHLAPTHYFNITPHGMSYLWRDLEIMEQGSVGLLSEAVRWMCREAGVPEVRVREHAPDNLAACSGTWLLGRKS